MNTLKSAFEKALRSNNLLIEVKSRQEKEKELLKMARFMLINMDKNPNLFKQTKPFISRIAFNGDEKEIDNVKFNLQMLFFPSPKQYEANKKSLLKALKMSE